MSRYICPILQTSLPYNADVICILTQTAMPLWSPWSPVPTQSATYVISYLASYNNTHTYVVYCNYEPSPLGNLHSLLILSNYLSLLCVPSLPWVCLQLTFPVCLNSMHVGQYSCLLCYLMFFTQLPSLHCLLTLLCLSLLCLPIACYAYLYLEE